MLIYKLNTNYLQTFYSLSKRDCSHLEKGRLLSCDRAAPLFVVSWRKYKHIFPQSVFRVVEFLGTVCSCGLIHIWSSLVSNSNSRVLYVGLSHSEARCAFMVMKEHDVPTCNHRVVFKIYGSSNGISLKSLSQIHSSENLTRRHTRENKRQICSNVKILFFKLVYQIGSKTNLPPRADFLSCF